METKQTGPNISFKVELQSDFDIEDTANSNIQHWNQISRLQNGINHAKNFLNQPLHFSNISLLNNDQRAWIHQNKSHYYTLIALITVSIILLSIIIYKIYSICKRIRQPSVTLTPVGLPLMRFFEA